MHNRLHHHELPTDFTSLRATCSASSDGTGDSRSYTQSFRPSLPFQESPRKAWETGSYTVRYYKNPFRQDAAPDHEWVGKPWDFVRKFALGHMFPEGWVVINEATGEECPLEEIGVAYHNQEGLNA